VEAWEASSAVELLAASFFADDEFCANAELVAANAINQFTRQSPAACGVKCHVTWLVMKTTGAIAFFKEEKSEFVAIAIRSLRFAFVNVRCREWNCSCSN